MAIFFIEKHRLKSLLAVLISLLCTTAAVAYDFKVGSICYNILSADEKTVEVTHDSDNSYYSGSIAIPSSITKSGTTYTVTGIRPETFWGCTGLTGISIPAGVTTIADYTFYGCTGLTSVTLYNGITSIGNYAFANCERLAKITIPNSVTAIGTEAFSGCTALESITLSNSIKKIEENTFRRCGKLASIAIPDKVTTIDNGAFEFCIGLENITMNKALESIGDYAFQGCGKLASIAIPASVRSIGASAFDGCTSLTEIEIPSKVTAIGASAFDGCYEFTKILVASSNTAYYSQSNGNAIIEKNTQILIRGCENTIIPEGTTGIGEWAFYNNAGATNIRIPGSVKTISDWAFFGCSGLTEIRIPEGTTNIGKYAFYRCTGLTEITIPKSVTEIGDGAFFECKKTDKIHSKATTPATIEYYTFDGLYDSATLYVPKGSKAKYQAAAHWSKFKKIVETDFVLMGDVDGDGVIDVADVTKLIAIILGVETEIPGADIDGDNIVDVADVTKLIAIILGGDGANAAPARAAATRAAATSAITAEGEAGRLLVGITNPEYAFSAVQFDLYLPDGIAVETVQLGSRTSDHEAPACQVQADGAMRVVIASMSNSLFGGTDGDVAAIALTADGAADGDYEFQIKKAVISQAGSKEVLDGYRGSLTVSGGTTHIGSIAADASAPDGVIYDLQGRKVTETVKGGIYIKNGKKFIAR